MQNEQREIQNKKEQQQIGRGTTTTGMDRIENRE
jgi:hypothetical protein